LSEDAFRKKVLTNGLRRALERDELYLNYQPQMNAAGTKIIAFEALAHWQNRD
jgi:sensor c-di-GMP phosphodiesterase-like protein